MKFTEQRDGHWTEQDRLDLARLLVKGGYTVRTGREKPQGKNVYQYYVEVVETERAP
jgi:hypothetical protein